MLQFKDSCKRFASLAALIALALLLMQSALFAQQTGTITGTVQDSTGAVIPGAKIKLTNTASHDVRESISNAEGFFAFAGVVTGTYDVRVEAKGFSSWEKKAIGVQPGDKRTVGTIALMVGGAEQVVTVESTGSGVDIVASGDRAALLTPENIKNLTLQGRDVTELLKVLPGFSNTTGGGGLANTSGYNPMITSIGSAIGNGYAANGAPNRAGGVDLLSDGAHVIDPGCNCNATQTINADMIQEVKVATSTFGADSAKGPVVVQAVGKAGSSEYHGSAYLHFRDSSMFSNDAGLKAQNMSRPSERYWYPGGQVGGPIPGTNKKITFFSGYEYYNQNFPDTDVQAGLLQAVVPTASMRNGLFDTTLSDNAALCSALSGWHPACGALTDSHHSPGDAAYNAGTGFYQNEWGAWTPVTNSDISAYLDPSMVN